MFVDPKVFDLVKRGERTDYDRVDDWEYYNSSGVLTSSGSNVGLREHKRFSGWGIPHFHARRRRGEFLPHTPYRAYQVLGETTGYKNVNSSYTTGNYCIYDKWVLTEDDVAVYTPVLPEGLIQEAASRIYTSKGYDALTSIAELTDITRSFNGVLKLFRTLISGKSLRQIWNSISLDDEWLSFRYGWRVLVYDLLNLSETIANYNVKFKLLSARARDKYSVTNVDVTSSDFTHYTLEHKVLDEVQVELLGCVNAKINVPKIRVNAVATAWELIPLSFVIDWLWSVGTAINAASFAVLEKQHAASYGYKITMERTYTTSFTAKASWLSGTHWQNGFSKAILTVRVPHRVPFIPYPVLRLNALKILDFGAILRQALKQRR